METNSRLLRGSVWSTTAPGGKAAECRWMDIRERSHKHSRSFCDV